MCQRKLYDIKLFCAPMQKTPSLIHHRMHLGVSKQVAGKLRLDLAQFRELEAFAKFGSDLDKATQQQLTRGERMVEILKQDQYKPLTVGKQILIIYTGNAGFLDDLPLNKIADFETGLFEYFDSRHADILQEIEKKKKISDENEEKLKKYVGEFKQTFRTEA